ncbi:MAG: gliding motility-associated C-terminal domain-containing protein [Crocinitomicaceae bacterium]
MKQFLITLFCLGMSLSSLAQLDVKHFIPPLYGRTNVQNHYLILSTPSAAPVTVDVKNGQGVLIYSVVITDVAPSTQLLGTGYAAPGIINTNELNTVNPIDGFIIEATAPIYANLRHVQNAQGLSLTSKGAGTGLGTRFRSGHIFNSAAIPYVKASQISVMASEDNTTVTFSDISNNVIFKNTTTTAGTSDDITVVLNEGESYTIAAWVDEPGATGNVNDVNGTLITSDKPIACNTGSWLGGAHGNARDIGVDQIVPAELTGKEYIFVEGNGNANTERPLIVADVDNTDIFVNGNAVPVATINAGDYFYLPQTAYSANDNIYIVTSEPVFMYQSLSGTSPAATCLNFIPPLRCNGFKKVVIPSVNLVGDPTVSITARTNASVWVNGNPTPLTGGLTVPGNPCWVTYKIPGGTGDFVVESDSIINVALLTLLGVRGSAGYFTGFAQFVQIDQGDTTSFIVCEDSASSFVTYSIDGPYIDVEAEFHDPALNGQVIVDGFNGDSLFFTYIGDPATTGPDSLDLKVCKLLECCGAAADTICEITTLVFTNIQDIEIGIGDSIDACADTSDIALPDLILGVTDPNGYWEDTDNSGALFGDSISIASLTPGIYHFTYFIQSGTYCIDSTVVTVNIQPMSTSECCSIEPDFVLADPNCFGDANGSLLITDIYATDFSIDAGTTNQATGTFNGLTAANYNVQLSFGPNCVYDTTIVLNQPDELTATFTIDSVSCNGLCDGELQTNTLGGTAPYNYSIGGTPAQVSGTFSALCAGPATITITDDHNCQVVYPNTIFEPAVLTLDEDIIIDETCTLGNGEITVIAAGGTTAYTYTLNAGPAQSSPTFSDLSEGNYIVEVTDFNGCTAQENIAIVNNPSPIPFVDVLNDVTCAGGLNGSVTIGVNFGTPPFQFSLDAGPNQASNNFATVGAGNHTVVVTDDNGCTGFIDFIIGQPTPLVFNTTVTHVSCFGVCDGEIEVNPSGATPPYNYSADNGVTYSPLNTLSNLCAGNIDLVVQDDNGCLANAVVVINEPTVVSSVQGTVDPLCHQTPGGEISFAPSGGTPGYQFSVDNGATFSGTSPITGLFAGDYDVIVEDANGCQFTEQITIIDPPPFDFFFVANDPSNCGANDGSFEIVAAGGLPSYEYSIDGGVTTQTDNGFFNNLFSGLYNLVVEDANGCIDSTYSALSDNVMTTNVDFEFGTSCYNSCDGYAEVSQVNGAAPFTYTINTGGSQATGAFPNLCAGQHYITVEDNGQCISIEEINIPQPDSITFDNILVNITCPEGTDGEIDFSNVAGGDGANYTYSIDGGANFFGTSLFTGLTSGFYDVVVMDGNGCLGATQVELTEPDPFTAFIVTTDINCNGENTGFIQIVAGGSTSPYQYTLAGTNTTGIFGSLAAGPYNITITDDNGCTFDTTATLTEPTALNMVNALTNPDCFGATTGSVVVTANGGTTPYLFSSNGGTFLQSSNTLTGLADGCYDIYVEDDNGCNVTINECLIEPAELTMTLVTQIATCNQDNAEIDITAAGGTPGYAYSNDDGTTFQPGNLFTGLAPIAYDLVLEDANGCQIDSTITLLEDPVPQIDNVTFTNPLCFGGNEGTITITSSSGVGAHQYSITSAVGPYQASNNFTGLTDGSYTVFVQDANGCVAQSQIDLTEPAIIDIDASSTDLTCFENATGEISITATGGTVPYQYSIDNGINFQGVNQFTGLAEGNYDVVVEDVNGCQSAIVQYVGQPTALAFDPFTIVDASCYGVCDATITPNVIGGTPGTGYSYNWSGGIAGNADNSANNVCEGTYSVIVTDDNGCTIDSLNFVVSEPPLATIDSALTIGVSCFGMSDGTIDVYSSNAGFYSIGTGFSGTTNYGGLVSDIYTVYVQDVNGCTGDSMIVFVPTPQPLQAFVTPDDYICLGDSIFFSVVATGGTQPFVFDVNDGTSADETIYEPVFVDTLYYVTVTDANGCSVDSDTMYVDVAPAPELITSNDTTICAGEPLILSSIATDLLETYTYLWNTGDTIPYLYPNPTSNTTFYVDVTDECNVTTSDTIHVNIHPDPIITLTPDVLGGCPPFQVNYTIGVDIASLGSDLFWDANYGVIDSSNFSNLYMTYSEPGSGVINLNFTSANGCDVDTTFANPIQVYDLPEAMFTVNPAQPTIYDNSVDLVNTSSNYTSSEWYILGDTLTTENAVINLANLPTDSIITVCLQVENDFGCTDQVCGPIEIANELFLFVPNTIIIDSYSSNSVFKPVTNYFHPDWYQMYIFNRWGELIFETTDLDQGWDGTYNGVIVQDGVYIWKIVGAPVNNDSDLKEYHGHVTVLK